jgi:hypothetical protein
MKQFIVTPSMGKRLIGKAMVRHPAIQAVLAKGTLVIIAGTTNGYVAQEILAATGQGEFDRKGFRRGMVVPPSFNPADVGAVLAGDVILVDGQRVQGKQIFDVADQLTAGDVVLKGANAVNLCEGHAAVYIGHPAGGTIAAALPAVVGQRVRLIVPAGVEKRVLCNISDLVLALNTPGAEGPRMMQLPGEVFTELEAIELLSGATARILAGGGVYGAEGCVWIGAEGDEDQLRAASSLIQSVAGEPPCQP